MATTIYAEPPRLDDADNPVRFVVSGRHAACASGRTSSGASASRSSSGTAPSTAASRSSRWAWVPSGPSARRSPGMEMRVVGEADHECPAGVTGELVCRYVGGPTEDLQYLDNPEASAAKTRVHGFARATCAMPTPTAGCSSIIRKGGGLRHNGDFVLPDYVERAAVEYAGVTDACCYGVPAASGSPGESDVVLAVVPRAGTSFDPAALIAHLERIWSPTSCRRSCRSSTISRRPSRRIRRCVSPGASRSGGSGRAPRKECPWSLRK